MFHAYSHIIMDTLLCPFILIHIFGQLILLLCTTQIIASLKGVQSLKMTRSHVQPAFQTGCFQRSIFPDRSRMLRMRAAGFSSTLHLIDPLIAGTGWSSDTCYPTWLSVRWDHVETEMQRCSSKRLHGGCLMGSFQSR